MLSERIFVVSLMVSFVFCANISDVNTDLDGDSGESHLEATLFLLENTFMEMILDNREELADLRDEIGELRYQLEEQDRFINRLKRTVAKQNEVIISLMRRKKLNKIPTPMYGRQ